MKNETVEIIEEYRNGVTVRRNVNGIDVPVFPFEECKSVTIVRKIPIEEAKKWYGCRGTN